MPRLSSATAMLACGHVRIAFTAQNAANCVIGGNLSAVRFIDASGLELDVDVTTTAADEHDQLPVDELNGVAVHVCAQEGAEVKPASIRFSLPGQSDTDDSITAPWPTDLCEAVTVSQRRSPSHTW